MSTKPEGNLAEAVPEGSEVWQNPEDGQVHVRKVPRRVVLDSELEIVRNLAQAKAQTRYTIVDVKGKAIVLYAADDEIEARSRLMSILGHPDPVRLRTFMEQHLKYRPMLRFSLADHDTRTFAADRWCFLGSLDEWFPLSTGSLEELAENFIPHVGAESFFDLM